MKNKTVLLIGGTGAIGCYTSEELERPGYNVDIITQKQRENTAGVWYFTAEENQERYFREVYK